MVHFWWRISGYHFTLWTQKLAILGSCIHCHHGPVRRHVGSLCPSVEGTWSRHSRTTLETYVNLSFVRSDCAVKVTARNNNHYERKKRKTKTLVLTDMVENTNVKGDTLGNVWESFLGSSAKNITEIWNKSMIIKKGWTINLSNLQFRLITLGKCPCSHVVFMNTSNMTRCLFKEIVLTY